MKEYIDSKNQAHKREVSLYKGTLAIQNLFYRTISKCLWTWNPQGNMKANSGIGSLSTPLNTILFCSPHKTYKSCIQPTSQRKWSFSSQGNWGGTSWSSRWQTHIIPNVWKKNLVLHSQSYSTREYDPSLPLPTDKNTTKRPNWQRQLPNKSI